MPIKIKRTQKYLTYFELLLEIVVPIPTVLQSLDNKSEIAESYKSEYGIEKVVGNNVYFSKIMPFANDTPQAVIDGTLDAVLSNYETAFSQFALQSIDSVTGKTRIGTDWTYIPEPPTPPTPM